MAPSTLEHNLAALDRHAPDIAKLVRETQVESLAFEVVKTKTNAPSIRLFPAGMSKPVLLHSAYDPLREAQRWVESIEVSEPTNFIVMGAGLGYHLLMLFKARQPKIRFLFVIEHDPRILKMAMSAIDLRPLIQREGTEWLIGADPKLLPEMLGEKRTDIILHNCKIVPHEPSLQCYPAYYTAARAALVEALTYDEVNLRTTFESRGRNQFNTYMNLPAMFRGYFPKNLKDRFIGYPAIVVAAGPSLDKNLDLLRGVNDRAGVIIVDTAQSTFKRKGLLADAVVTGDPTPLNFSHFECVDSMGEAFLAFHPEVNRQITQKFVQHPYLLPLYDTDSELLTHLFDPENRCGLVERAMNVGHVALNFARHLGFGPVILIGFDLAFPPQGGTTHAADAAVSRTISAVQQDGTVHIGGKENRAAQESGKLLLVPGYYGDPVPTTVPFWQYIRALEKTVAECPVPVIDATEGGAAFEGTVRMPLQQAMETYLQKPGVKAVWDAVKNQPRNDFTVDEFTRGLARGREVLVAAQQTCVQLWGLIQDWQQKLQQPVLDMKDVEHSWHAFDQKWIAMVENEIFNAFLGSSVHHLYFVRQRTSFPEDNTAKAYLKSLVDKYTFILQEMAGILENFVQSIDLSIQALETMNS